MSQMSTHNHRIVSHEDWLKERKAHLAAEKAFTKARDDLSRQRRELPWVKVEKNYVFDTPSGKKTLADLFDGRNQLMRRDARGRFARTARRNRDFQKAHGLALSPGCRRLARTSTSTSTYPSATPKRAARSITITKWRSFRARKRPAPAFSSKIRMA